MDEQPNVVWLTLDSVRNDRTTMAGYGRETTPNMARIAAAAGGQAFTNCISHAIWSLPSDASTLTCTRPSYHGAGLWNEVLPEDITTVPERFSELGYRTVGVSGNAYCSDSTGLSRGFDRFDWLHRSNLLETAGPRIVARYLLGLRRHSAGYTAPLDHHRPEFIATELAKRQLRSLRGDEPFFMFVHTQGAHLPYLPPLPYRDAFTDGIEMSTDEAAETAYELSSNYYREIARGCEYDPEAKAALDAMYDGLLAYVDSRVGDLFECVRLLDLGPTVFVVTADHGDLLGEQGVLGHQLSLHDGLVNVPLVVHGLDSLTAVPGDALVQHADLMRALLAEAGAPEEALSSLHATDPCDERRSFALSQRGAQTYERAIEQVQQHDPTADLDRFHPGLLHAVVSERFKWLHSDRGDELYERSDEETEVSAAHPAVADDHRSFFERVADRPDERESTDRRRDLSPGMRDQLSDLGYVTK